MPDILVDRRDGLVTVTLNRPERLNAVIPEMWVELSVLFAEIAEREQDRVVVVTGAGDAFCAGADLILGGTGYSHPLPSMRGVANAALALHRLPKPTIARVDGVAIGAGCNLALGCDLVVASDRSKFCQIFAKRGMTVDFGGSWILPRLVGMHKAKELILLSGMIGAAEALDMGLINKVVTPEELDAAVAAWTEKLLAGPPLALSMSKVLLNQSFEMSMDQALEAESQAQAINRKTKDIAEAMTAFVEKRDPVFKGF